MDSPRIKSPTAFSIVEMLVVIVVLVILVSLIAPAVNGFGRSNALGGAGNLVTNLAALARQEAMSRNSLSALMLLGAQGTDADYRALTVASYQEGRGWVQITPWENLPTGIIVDCNAPADPASELGSFISKSPHTFPLLSRSLVQTNPPILYAGAQIRSFAVRIFLPNGSLMDAEQPAHLRLVEGVLQGERTVYTHPGSDGQPANYYDLALIGVTGAVKVTRPEDLL